jgi:16S rRNA U516 pseudouridylate synthase RsuA-like enzyme
MPQILQKILVAVAEALVFIALHKPRNVLSTVEAEVGDGRKTVRDLVEIPDHIHSVGRLDYESEGLVLMTNDDDLKNKLTHPHDGYDYPWEHHIDSLQLFYGA